MAVSNSIRAVGKFALTMSALTPAIAETPARPGTSSWSGRERVQRAICSTSALEARQGRVPQRKWICRNRHTSTREIDFPGDKRAEDFDAE